VLADKRGIGTVLQLLIDNALKFSRDEIRVGAQLEGDRVRLYVTDQGIGIPRQKQRQVFSLFFQGDLSSTRRYGGAGVGLSLAKLILDRHQSSIEVESELGKGSIFSFTLSVVTANTP
jgi:signal transduction histidine kinase